MLLGGGASCYFGWTMYGPGTLSDDILARFESGGARGWHDVYEHRSPLVAKADVDRPSLSKKLTSAIYDSPTSDAKYVLVAGPPGTGKSTAVRAAVLGGPDGQKRLWEHYGVVYGWEHPLVFRLRNWLHGNALTSTSTNGAIYVDTSLDPWQFPAALADASGFTAATSGPFGVARAFLSRVAFFAPPHARSEFRDPLLAVTRAAAKYKDKHGHPAVLVIDSADKIAAARPEYFDRLLATAEQTAAAGTLRFVFVVSDGNLLEEMRARHDWQTARSPARLPVVEVRNLELHDAMAYLKARGVAETDVFDAVRTITGGRLALLAQYADTRRAGESVSTTFARYSSRIEHVLAQDVRLPPHHPFFKALLVAVNKWEFRTHKREKVEELDHASALEALGGDEAALERLVKFRIIDAHFDSDGVMESAKEDAKLREMRAIKNKNKEKGKEKEKGKGAEIEKKKQDNNDKTVSNYKGGKALKYKFASRYAETFIHRANDQRR